MILSKRIAKSFFLSCVLIAQFLISSAAEAQSGDTLSDNKVHMEFTPYLVFGGLSGDLTIRGQTLPVNASAGDVLSNLKSGFLGRAAISYNRWFLGPDVMYIGLGGSSTLTSPGNRVSIPVDVSADQWAAELNSGYHVNEHFSVLTGVRYNNITSRFQFQGPLGTVQSNSGSFTWWDPFFGAEGELPLGKKFSASARFDIGGFGVGSRVAVNAEPLLNYRFNRIFSSSVGWKFIYQNYKNTVAGFEYDLLTQGRFWDLRSSGQLNWGQCISRSWQRK